MKWEIELGYCVRGFEGIAFIFLSLVVVEKKYYFNAGKKHGEFYLDRMEATLEKEKLVSSVKYIHCIYI